MAKRRADPLDTWVGLNAVATTLDEAAARTLLERELAGKCRKGFVFRLHSRINHVRAARERAELMRRVR
jgi:hypothetical protein